MFKKISFSFDNFLILNFQWENNDSSERKPKGIEKTKKQMCPTPQLLFHPLPYQSHHWKTCLLRKNWSTFNPLQMRRQLRIVRNWSISRKANLLCAPNQQRPPLSPLHSRLFKTCPSLLFPPLLTQSFQDLILFSRSQRAPIRAVPLPLPILSPISLLRLITLHHLTPPLLRIHPFLLIPLHQFLLILSLLIGLLLQEIHLMTPPCRGNPPHQIWMCNRRINRRVELY